MRLEELARQLRIAVGTPDERHARDVLAEGIRSFALGVVRGKRMRGLSDDDLNAVAQDVVNGHLLKNGTLGCGVLLAIESGAVTPGNEDAYTRSAALNRAKSRQRELARSPVQLARTDDPVPEPVDDPRQSAHAPSALVEEKERRNTLRIAVERIRTLLDQAPDNYRYIIEQHYLAERDLEDLVEEQFALGRQEGTSTSAALDPEGDRRRAQDRVHQWHARALDWLRERVMQSVRPSLSSS